MTQKSDLEAENLVLKAQLNALTGLYSRWLTDTAAGVSDDAEMLLFDISRVINPQWDSETNSLNVGIDEAQLVVGEDNLTAAERNLYELDDLEGPGWPVQKYDTPDIHEWINKQADT